MGPVAANINYAEIAREGKLVQRTLESPGWAIIERELEAYVEVHLRGMLGSKSENDRLIQYQLGRIAAVKQDIPNLVKQIVDRGQSAADVRREVESNV